MQIYYNGKTYIPKVSWVTEDISDYIKSGELIETKPCEHSEGWKCDKCMGEEGRQEIIKKQKELGLIEETKPEDYIFNELHLISLIKSIT